MKLVANVDVDEPEKQQRASLEPQTLTNLLSSPWLWVGYWQRLCTCYGACSCRLAVIENLSPPSCPFQTCTVFTPASVLNFKNLATKNSILQEVYSYGLCLKDLGAEGRKENSSPGCKGAVQFYCWNKHWLYRQTIRLSHFGTAVLEHILRILNKKKKKTFETPEIL